jgi:hypothetical protein
VGEIIGGTTANGCEMTDEMRAWVGEKIRIASVVVLWFSVGYREEDSRQLDCGDEAESVGNDMSAGQADKSERERQ